MTGFPAWPARVKWQMCWLSGEGFLASLQRRGRLVFLGGEAGAGKTTLAASALAAAPGGAEVRRGACDNITTAEALGPILEAQPEAHGGRRRLGIIPRR